MLFPFIWLLMTSIARSGNSDYPKLWPTRITFKAYVDIWKAIPLPVFVNTVVFAVWGYYNITFI